MEALGTLLKDKVFSSLYDPKLDELKKKFSEGINLNTEKLSDTLSKAKESTGILSKIPGVSEETKKQMAALLKKGEDLTKSTANMTPGAISSANESIQVELGKLMGSAKQEAKDAKKAVAELKAEEIKEKIENQTFSFTRTVKKLWDKFKWYFLWIGLTVLALWGGSLASNVAMSEPWYMRLYYFIYGTGLFPVSFLFAISRAVIGKTTTYHALLAPLIPSPSINPFLRLLLFPFIYTPVMPVMPLPVQAVINPQALSETNVARMSSVPQAAAPPPPPPPPPPPMAPQAPVIQPQAPVISKAPVIQPQAPVISQAPMIPQSVARPAQMAAPVAAAPPPPPPPPPPPRA